MGEIGFNIALAGENLAILHLTVENTGVLTRVLRELRKRDVQILNLLVDGSDKPPARCILVLRSSKQFLDLKEVMERIPGVTAVELIPLVHRPAQPPVVAKTITIPLAMVKGLLKEFRRVLGEDAASTILWYQGFSAGGSIYEWFKSVFKFAREREILELAGTLAGLCGWGLVEVVEIDEGACKARIRLYNSFECSLFLGEGKRASHFFRGLVAGFLTGYFGVKVRAVEVKCIAAGDPYCEFKVFPFEELRGSHSTSKRSPVDFD